MKIVLLVVSLIAAQASVAGGQSLAEVARLEEARRKAVKVPGKVYTNTDLKPDPSKGSAPEPPAAGAVAVAPSLETPGPGVPAVNLLGGKVDSLAETGAAQPGLKRAPEDEAYWKGQITSARAALERSKVLSDALQSRVNALATDIVNRDDPAQRAQLELERQRALAEFDRMKIEIAEQIKAIADIEEEARKAGVPPGWLR